MVAGIFFASARILRIRLMAWGCNMFSGLSEFSTALNEQMCYPI